MNSISSEIYRRARHHLASIAGIVVGTVLLVAALNATHGFSVSTPLQCAAIATLTFINLCVWRESTIPPMSSGYAVFVAFIAAVLIAIIAVIDTFIGFSLGAKNIPDAFIHSGPFGGIADVFLFVCGVFIGVPTLVRSVCQFHSRPGR